MSLTPCWSQDKMMIWSSTKMSLTPCWSQEKMWWDCFTTSLFHSHSVSHRDNTLDIFKKNLQCYSHAIGHGQIFHKVSLLNYSTSMTCYRPPMFIRNVWFQCFWPKYQYYSQSVGYMNESQSPCRRVASITHFLWNGIDMYTESGNM